MRAKDINLKNKISPEIDLNEFTNYFFFDLNDVKHLYYYSWSIK